jgi:Flp pilus assembly protein TadB
MAASILSGLLPNMMVGADQAMAPVQQVLDGGGDAKAKAAQQAVQKQSSSASSASSASASHDHKKKHKPKSRRECLEEERIRKQQYMEDTVRKLILILLLFLLLFIVIMGLFALGHHARWQASLLPDKSDAAAPTVSP